MIWLKTNNKIASLLKFKLDEAIRILELQSYMRVPNIQYQHSEQQFDKDAQGAHEFSFHIEQQDEKFSYHFKYYDAYTDKETLGQKDGKILRWFEKEKLVKVQFDNGDIDFLNQSKENFVSDDQHGFFYFLLPAYENQVEGAIAPLVALVDDLYEALTEEKFSFAKLYQEPNCQLKTKQVSLNIRFDKDSTTPIRLETFDAIYAFQIEIGIHLQKIIPRESKITNHGYLKAVCLKKEHRLIAETLAHFMAEFHGFSQYK